MMHHDASLSGNDGIVVAHKCQELLKDHDITDIDVEIRESVVSCHSIGLSQAVTLCVVLPFQDLMQAEH
jgi:hypothetical protein